MGSFGAAAQFLTRLPLSRLQATAEERARAPAWFGLIGLGIGLALAGAERVLRYALPLLPCIVCVLILNAALTGGLHLDGLADTADGLGAPNAERALAIMRDSRIGTYGVLALFAVLALQGCTLAALRPAALSRALIFAPAWGRVSMVASAAMSRPARTCGLGAAFIAGIRPQQAFLAAVPVALAAALSGGASGWVAGLVAMLLAGGMAVVAHRRWGGQTGDTLGCLNELVETATYFAFLGIRW